MYFKIEIDSFNCHYLVLRTICVEMKKFLSIIPIFFNSRFQNSNDQCIITSDDNAAEMFDG